VQDKEYHAMDNKTPTARVFANAEEKLRYEKFREKLAENHRRFEACLASRRFVTNPLWEGQGPGSKESLSSVK
jgi:hypothetical protein